MIVSTSLAKVGHRQAPHSKKPIPQFIEGWVFYLPETFSCCHFFLPVRSENRINFPLFAFSGLRFKSLGW